jgi:spore maturation protein CgeB
MKVCYLTSYYPPFMDNFFRNHDCAHLTFSETLSLLLAEFFADTGSLYHYTNTSGNNAFIIISNCEPLQKKWARENGLNFSEKTWSYEIAYAQLKSYSPDVFYLEYVPEFFGDFTAQVSSFCKKIVSWISSPFNPATKLNNIDIIFSSTPDFVDSFRSNGIKAEYMHPAFDRRILDNVRPSSGKTIPFSFVGGWSDVHINRKKALKQLVGSTPIQLWGYNYKTSYSKKQLAYYKNLLVGDEKQILRAYKGEAWGLNMYEIIQNSLITFNIHESLLKGYVGNMRMFEASGMGTMILNDNGKNLASLFKPGVEIETYQTIEEAIEKVKYYIANPQKAITIGKNAQQKTLSDYNFENYVNVLFSHLNKLL